MQAQHVAHADAAETKAAIQEHNFVAVTGLRAARSHSARCAEAEKALAAEARATRVAERAAVARAAEPEVRVADARATARCKAPPEAADGGRPVHQAVPALAKQRPPPAAAAHAPPAVRGASHAVVQTASASVHVPVAAVPSAGAAHAAGEDLSTLLAGLTAADFEPAEAEARVAEVRGGAGRGGAGGGAQGAGGGGAGDGRRGPVDPAGWPHGC